MRHLRGVSNDKRPTTRTPVRPTVTASTGQPPAERSTRADIDAFVAQSRAAAASPGTGRRGRLMFALDATMSRQAAWDRACAIQADMFDEAGKVGGLDIQLVYFRGFGECRASKWVSDTSRLRDLMTRIDCRGGLTQIRKVLRRAIEETRTEKVQAVVYVGDCMEEGVDELCARAGELGRLLRAVAAYAAGGRAALADMSARGEEGARLLIGKMS